MREREIPESPSDVIGTGKFARPTPTGPGFTAWLRPAVSRLRTGRLVLLRLEVLLICGISSTCGPFAPQASGATFPLNSRGYEVLALPLPG